MKEFKSKLTGNTALYTEEEYAIIKKNPKLMSRFTVTDIRMKPIVPSIKEAVKEVKQNKNTK